MRERYVHVVRSDNGAARRFERSTSCCVPRHWGKGEVLVSLIEANPRLSRFPGVHLSEDGATASSRDFAWKAINRPRWKVFVPSAPGSNAANCTHSASVNLAIAGLFPIICIIASAMLSMANRIRIGSCISTICAARQSRRSLDAPSSRLKAMSGCEATGFGSRKLRCLLSKSSTSS